MLDIKLVSIGKILTRTSGYLTDISSHSLQPYRGCSWGNSLCGTGCYVQHNGFITKGRPWGSFLEVRSNTAESYLKSADRERAWAHAQGLPFSIFCSSSTDPFLPQERRYRITRSLLTAMIENPPDLLILQTRSPLITEELNQLGMLHQKTKLRIHMTIEGDQERLPGLPAPATSIQKRMDACLQIKEADLYCLVTVAPLHPLKNPQEFFEKIGNVAQGVVIDHFIGGDGSQAGSRTLRTPLIGGMSQADPESVKLDYRNQIVNIARQIMPGRVGVSQAGFAGKLS